MLLIALTPFILASDTGLLDEALAATEAPRTLRAAFTVEISSADARRSFRFDPRLRPAERWRMISDVGEDSELDRLGAEWGAEPAPDARLFPDDLRASLDQTVEVEDLGHAWRVRFRHRPSLNDTELDVWAAGMLQATAWLDPTSSRFLRIDHELPRPVAGPRGGELTRYHQTHFLTTDPTYGLSFISGFSVELEARSLWRSERRAYHAHVTEIELFFASAADELAFLAAQELAR